MNSNHIIHITLFQFYFLPTSGNENLHTWWWQKLGRDWQWVNIQHTDFIWRGSVLKLNKVESKKQYHIEISNRFAALENLDFEVHINRASETIRENINISAKESLVYYELMKHKPLFNEGCSELLDQRKQAKLQWLHDPSKIIGDNLSNIRLEASRHFRNKKREYVKDKIDELATNSKNKNIRDLYREINGF
jgi:hypothetical protein